MANISGAAAQSLLAHYVGLVDAGASAATLEIYTADYSTLLITYTLASTPFGTPTTPTPPAPSVATAASLPIAGTAVATGTAAAFRQKNGDGTVVAQGTGSGNVGTSAAIVILSNTSIIDEQEVNLIDYKVAQPTLIGIYTP